MEDDHGNSRVRDILLEFDTPSVRDENLVLLLRNGQERTVFQCAQPRSRTLAASCPPKSCFTHGEDLQKLVDCLATL